MIQLTGVFMVSQTRPTFPPNNFQLLRISPGRAKRVTKLVSVFGLVVCVVFVHVPTVTALLVPPTSSSITTTTTTTKIKSMASIGRKIVNRACLSEHVWRRAADDHKQKVLEMLQPGLIPPLPSPNGSSRNRRKRYNNTPDASGVASLDPRHPVYNFLVEYYGLKGSKGVRRLTRWSPSPRLLLSSLESVDPSFTGNKTWRIESHEELTMASRSIPTMKNRLVSSPIMTRSEILLEGASEDDFGVGLLHRRGAKIDKDGVVYCPTDFFTPEQSSGTLSNHQARKVSPFVWYQSILKQTMSRDPILHCYNTHEWAMMYRPDGAPPPPSAQYQSHLPLRVSQQVINETVERKGVSCTHVDALRFFADSAVKLNKYSQHGKRLERHEQPQLEQPGCLHAQMDLLKICLKLQPFVDSSILRDALRIALDARRLDVAASPYDASSYGVQAVPIETHEGRAEYKDRQTKIWQRSESIRQDLLQAYDDFLELTLMGEDVLTESQIHLPVGDKKSGIIQE
jgi:hypothetical protein